jgi:hypothetical protein
MAVTASFRGIDQVKGPYQGNPAATPLHLIRFIINASGTYATGGFQVDLCTPFVGTTGPGSPSGSRMGVTAIQVIRVSAFGDYFDGTNSYDADNASLALASGGTLTSISSASTNNLLTIKLFSGTNGTGGSEIAASTPLANDLGVVATVQLTFGSLGNV